jgi:hypothetical protein
VKAKPRPAPSKDDRETVTPPHRWLGKVRTPDPGAAATKVSVKGAERAAAVAAYEAMRRARPLVPPPLPKHNDTRTAGARALAKEIRTGAYEP